MTTYNRLKSIPKGEFPLFLTVKKLVYMLDGDCSYSFFSRDTTGKIFGMDSSNEWHNESKEGALMINQYQRDTFDFDKKIKKIGKEMIQAEDMTDEQKLSILQQQGFDVGMEGLEDFKNQQNEDSDSDLEEIRPYKIEELLKNQERVVQGSKMSIQTQMFSQEVDFEMFEKKFWGKNKGSLKISALNLWTEIYSVIKGGVDAISNALMTFHNGVVSWPRYRQMKSSMEEYITEEERRKVYLLYCRYEKWKTDHHYYDFMDVVRHVFKFYPFWSTKGMDYLVVDEVQDLAPLTIQLLLVATGQNVFFCGDTAQTIAKGVTFRFHDLKPVFTAKRRLYYKNPNMEKHKEGPKVIQLTKNYRSHQRILELANSVVDLIEHWFPTTIDKLQREESDIDGPKPIILKDFDEEDLRKMMMATSQTDIPKFGCNQVVIVRTQEAKNNLPLFLKKALCLTVYEAKGLEFDDVILYNFFTDSQCTQQWRIIDDVEVYTETRKKLRIADNLTIEGLDFNEYKKMIKALEQEYFENTDKKYETEEVTYLKSKREREEIDRKFGLLCVELKYLYVSITRPKTKLIIYDDSGHGQALLDHWTELDLVDVVRKGEEQNHPVLSKAFEAAENEVETQEQWRALGIKLFKKKYYDSVIKCFEHSGDEDLKIRTLGYMHAEEAGSLLSEGETLLYQAKKNLILTKHEKGQKKREGKKLKEKALIEFRKAGDYFEQVSIWKNAAQCFYT